MGMLDYYGREAKHTKDMSKAHDKKLIGGNDEFKTTKEKSNESRLPSKPITKQAG